MLMGMLFFIYAIIGMQLFGNLVIIFIIIIITMINIIFAIFYIFNLIEICIPR